MGGVCLASVHIPGPVPKSNSPQRLFPTHRILGVFELSIYTSRHQANLAGYV